MQVIIVDKLYLKWIIRKFSQETIDSSCTVILTSLCDAIFAFLSQVFVRSYVYKSQQHFFEYVAKNGV